MSKFFKFAGVSKLNGEFKVRYANDAARAKVLTRNGHSDVFFIELEQPEHKMDCVDALLDVIENEHPLSDDAVNAIREEAKLLGFVLEG